MTVGAAVGVTPGEVQSIVSASVDDYLPLAGGRVIGDTTFAGGFDVESTQNTQMTISFGDNRFGRVSFEQPEGEVGSMTATAFGTLEMAYAGTRLSLSDTEATFDKPLRAPQTPEIDPSPPGGFGFDLVVTKLYVDALIGALQARADSIEDLLSTDDTALDTLQEIVERIKAVDSEVDGLQLADVAGLVAALSGKAPTGHDHTLASITDFDAADYLTSSGHPKLNGTLRLDPDSGAGVLRLYESNALRVELYGLADRLLLRHNTTSGATDLSVYEDHVNSEVPVRAPNPTRGDELTPRDYVESNYLNKAGGEMLGKLKVRRGFATVPAIEFSSGPYLWCDSNGLKLMKSAAQQLFDLFNHGNKTVFRLDATAAADGGTHAAQIQLMKPDGGRFVLSATNGSNYIEYRFPESVPSVGQKLEVVHVNGGVVTFGYV